MPETGARLFLDFLIQTFRLRGCDIKIDGKFPVPCTMFYEKRCVAPCVESLCDKENYDETVKFIKLFLENKAEDLEKLLIAKIETAAENLDFETAGKLRDFLQNVQNVRSETDWNYRIEDAVDSFETEETNEKIFVRLVSQRGRKVLGKRVFVFERIEGFDAADILTQVISQFYEFYEPKEIRVSTDFPNRKFLSDVLSLRAGHKLKIEIVNENNQKITTERAFGRTKFEFDFRQIKPPKNFAEIQIELQREFNLNKKPRRIEGFDVAHISGTDFVAAKSVWANGKFLVGEYEFWFLPEKSELETLEKGISERLRSQKNLPDLILIDGGKSQLKTALRAVEKMTNRKFSVVAASKPTGRHNEISHFITEDGNVIKMKPESDVFQILARLRDEAHELANSVHRKRRDTSHFYEVAALLPSINEKERRYLLQKYGSLKELKSANKDDLIKLIGSEKVEIVCNDLREKDENQKIEPLIVPIRFDDEDGDARDLQPLSTLRNKK
ncbi:MAG: hypothetical protein LC768_07335 [Acidobacteria bacterium]|nr:hypothetical protein [Acidobacteriota bacterium]